MLPHPNFPKLMVYDGTANEIAHQGAFYKVPGGTSLTKISSEAYGSAIRPLIGADLLSKSAYNKTVCAYRKKKPAEDYAKCKTPRTDPGVGWISFCPSDYKARALPTIWIPALDTKAEPEQITEASSVVSITEPVQAGFGKAGFIVIGVAILGAFWWMLKRNK